MMNFETGLLAHLESKPKLNLREKRLLKFLRSKPSKRRTRILKRLEANMRDARGVSATAKVSWEPGQFDWDKFLEFLMKLLEAFLKFAPLFI